MAPPQKPMGGAPSAPGERPRAQVAYEGDDEFSAMSLDPARRRKQGVDLDPGAPGSQKEVKVDDLKPKSKGVIGLMKKIFDW